MNNIKCPVCAGFATTSGKPNLINHIKNIAKGELLRKHILGDGATPHADFLKDKAKLALTTVQNFIVEVGGKKMVSRI